MEIFIYIVIPILTFFGITSLPTRWIVIMNAGSASILNFFPIVAAFIIWTVIDVIHINILNTPIPIGLFLICWFLKLLEDYFIKKADWQMHVNMAEAWVLFGWAIIAMFGNYRAWF